MNVEHLKVALMSFVYDIEVSGGIVEDDNGNVYPVADPAWPDLAISYLKACEALDQEPMVKK